MKMRYTFFQLLSERAWVPSDVPICSCITSSALSYCAVEQGLLSLVGQWQVSPGQRPSCLEPQGHPGDCQYMSSLAVWISSSAAKSMCSVRHQGAAKAASLPQECLHLKISPCASQIKSLASCLTCGGVCPGLPAGDSSTACVTNSVAACQALVEAP